MKDIVWLERSCCGDHRQGEVKFSDGEQLNVTELYEGEEYAVRSIKGGAQFAESKRVSGGFQCHIPKARFEDMRATWE